MSEVIEIEFDGRIPSKKNGKRIVKMGKRSGLIGSVGYLEWKKEAAWQIKRQYRESRPLGRLWRVQLIICYGDARRRDLTNTAESVMDALVDGGVIADDSWQVTGAVILIPSYVKGKFGCRCYLWPSILKENDGR